MPAEKGMTIRFPSTANFLVDNQDKTSGQSASNFQISRPQSLLNGFFTRIAPNEVVLDWCVDNISTDLSNNNFSITIGATTYGVSIPNNKYTIKLAVDALIGALNALSVAGHTFSAVLDEDVSGAVSIVDSNAAGFIVNPSKLQRQLNIVLNPAAQKTYPVVCPNLQAYTYIDFTSNQLTYNQDLKDTSTEIATRDILYRWYFADEVPVPEDAYGYPILQGYKQFVQRRPIAFPKQIRWENNMPIGQVNFQVFGSDGNLLPGDIDMEWKMTMLVSEC